MLLVP
jgi:hypothetical protein